MPDNETPWQLNPHKAERLAQRDAEIRRDIVALKRKISATMRSILAKRRANRKQAEVTPKEQR